jgi:CRP-like cAMP-binding protein
VPNYVVVVAQGSAEVSVAGRVVANLEAGKFIGEIAFLNQRPATATVRANGMVRALCWPQQRLRRAVRRDPAMHAAVYGAMGQDLAEKIADADVALAGQ